MMWGKYLYKYCTSTFPISTLAIMFMYIMWWYTYEYHLCNCFVEINSIQFNSIFPLSVQVSAPYITNGSVDVFTSFTLCCHKLDPSICSHRG